MWGSSQKICPGQISFENTLHVLLAKKASIACWAKLSTQEGQLCTWVPTNFFGNRFSAVRLDMALPGVEISSGYKIERYQRNVLLFFP